MFCTREEGEETPVEDVDVVMEVIQTSLKREEAIQTSSLVKWSFGTGNEGVFTPPTSDSKQVLLVGNGVPGGEWS